MTLLARVISYPKHHAMPITITNYTKTKLPKWPYEQMLGRVLGANYDLSLVIVGDTRMKKLNMQYRGKTTTTDILSFPLDKKNGEIFISPRATLREAKKFDRKYNNFVAFLFIHGLYHLKGMDHSSTMESSERKIRAEFGV